MTVYVIAALIAVIALLLVDRHVTERDRQRERAAATEERRLLMRAVLARYADQFFAAEAREARQGPQEANGERTTAQPQPGPVGLG